MRTVRTTLDHLERIAHDGRHTITVDAVRRVAYLRRGRVRYEAPLEDAA
jgi:hypothetical protein